MYFGCKGLLVLVFPLICDGELDLVLATKYYMHQVYTFHMVNKKELKANGLCMFAVSYVFPIKKTKYLKKSRAMHSKASHYPQPTPTSHRRAENIEYY